MNTIISNNNDDKQLNFTINRFFKDNRIGSILKQCNFSKEKGLSCIKIFQYIFMLVFTDKNFFRTFESKKNSDFAKDVVYRFLNSSSFNWRKFLLSSKIIKNVIIPLTSKDRINILVVDDSLYNRSGSKSVELLARVRDYISH